MPAPSLTERQEILLQHLESVFLLAQAVSPDTVRAARLVEATYTQAFVTLPVNQPPETDKQWLFHLLIQIYREQDDYKAPATEPDTLPGPADAALHMLRRRLAQQVVDRVLPAVLATLPDEQRLILLLCDAEGLSCADAGYVLGLDDACSLLARARIAVEHALHADVSAREQHLLTTGLPDDWLRATLRRTVEAEFDPASASLRQAVLSATQAPPAPPESSVPPEPPSPRDAGAPGRASTPGRAARPRLPRLVIVLLLIGAVAWVGYFASRSLKRKPVTNLITLSVEQADAVRPVLETGSPAQAEAFAWNELAWRLTLPTIHHAVLTGAGMREIAPNVTVPVFLYEDTFDDDAARQITLYVFSYVLLDRFQDRVQLEPEILRQIQNDQQFDLHDLGERNALVWRNRDDIYVAVTDGDPDALRKRIVFPS